LKAGLVIIPTYNERDNIEHIIRRVMQLDYNFHILVVDDGSPDGTADCVRSQQEQYSQRLHLLEREGKLGLGTAYIAGFRWGLERNYDYLYEMDADFSHPPQHLDRFYEILDQKKCDIIVGSRYVKGGGVKNWPRTRLMLSYGASLYVRALTWMNVKDPTAGFVGYRREVLEELDLDKIRFIGYAFQIEMKFAAWTLGFKIKEFPITFIDREMGISKMHKGIVKEAIWGVMQMKWKSFFSSYRYHKKN
jgi:dolichol-phosphate mannosyltransferase